MEKLYTKKLFSKAPRFIIVEGFWQIGKTKFINYLSKKYDYKIIREPNHINCRVKKDISGWYYKKHLGNLKKVEKLLNQKKKIIMERSIISSLAFTYAKTNKISSDFKEGLEKINNLEKDFLVIFLFADKDFIKKRILKIKDDSVKKQILENPRFYKNYFYFYKKILPPLMANKIIFINVSCKG